MTKKKKRKTSKKKSTRKKVGKKKTKKKSKAAGRPLLLTAGLQAKIVKDLKDGAYIETACAASGIHKSTLYDWLKRGAREKRRVDAKEGRSVTKKEAPFVSFSDAVEVAQAESELDDNKAIKDASKKSWQAAAWRLERKHPDRYGHRTRVDHAGAKDGEPIKVKVKVGWTDEFVDGFKRKILEIGEDDEQ